MSKRVALMLATMAAQLVWINASWRSGLMPPDSPVVQGVLVHGPMLIVAGVALVLAVRRGLFTPAELGLEAPAWTMRCGRAGRVLLLLAIFLAGALIDISGPLGTMTANGMSYSEIVHHLFRYEYRYIYGRLEPPLSTWDVGVHAVSTIVFPPLTEEIPYRALFIPVALSRLSRSGAAMASGVVFFLYHWLAGWAPHPAFFLHGWAFAWAFMLVGLAGSIAAHAGVLLGVVVLGTFAGFASTP
ncbi:CPBP family intramembrane glutamic endopeptidase [Nannocystis pusilla]|uniref:CPBP family intramembrane metalloprotease n=1 Tax=Nannocystis pusilla TaxID=889268 RepID=A0ABS7TVL1_9BACT|nr:CPBP family intramembrane glutamic endopeptidase [Nannocystis pusilla]MBZ5712298.1 CPBP family intramembrane metalloprotease [Nannocystis pusilla]